MKNSFAIVTALVLAGLAVSADARTVVTDGSGKVEITADTTWGGVANPGPIILDVPVFVKNNATLTILPGTVVRGQPRSGAVVSGNPAGTPGVLIITQAGRIVADASASNPIIMTTAAVDNDSDGVADDLDGDNFEDSWPGFDPAQLPSLVAEDPNDALFLDDTPKTAPLAPLNSAGESNVALWGGLVILGSAPTNDAGRASADPNNSTVQYGQTLIEGLTVPGFPPEDAVYGGVLPHDNSGIVRYVSVRHAGDELGAGNELNGISLGGVGDGTTFEYVEVYANFDDGIEWFGGTVNGSHLVVALVGDDMFDVDEGYTGINQFLFGVMPFFDENDGTPFGSASGDKACEFDGDNYRPDNTFFNNNVNTRLQVDGGALDPTPWPLSRSTWWNMTILGTTLDAGQEFTPVDVNSTNRGIQFRNGFAGEVYNSIVVNTGSRSGIELDTDIGDGAPGFDSLDNAQNGLIALVSSTLDDGAALDPGEELLITARGDALAAALGGTPNVVNDGNFNGLVNEDQSFDPQGNASGKLVSTLKSSPIDPRPNIGLVGTAGGVEPAGPGLDRAATYRGAFPIGQPMWTDGWTVLSIAGLQ